MCVENDADGVVALVAFREGIYPVGPARAGVYGSRDVLQGRG